MREGNYDFVVCVEATSNMKPISQKVNQMVKKFISLFTESLEEWDQEIKQLRVKFIVFRDFSCCPKAIEESPFFTLPKQTNEYIFF